MAGAFVVVSRLLTWGRTSVLDAAADHWIVVSEGAALPVGVVSSTRLHAAQVWYRRPDRASATACVTGPRLGCDVAVWSRWITPRHPFDRRHPSAAAAAVAR